MLQQQTKSNKGNKTKLCLKSYEKYYLLSYLIKINTSILKDRSGTSANFVTETRYWDKQKIKNPVPIRRTILPALTFQLPTSIIIITGCQYPRIDVYQERQTDLHISVYSMLKEPTCGFVINHSQLLYYVLLRLLGMTSLEFSPTEFFI